jgi:hypothetical protein
MALCMLMFTLRVRVTLWTLPILNMSKNPHLEGHIVRLCFISRVLFNDCMFEWNAHYHDFWVAESSQVAEAATWCIVAISRCIVAISRCIVASRRDFWKTTRRLYSDYTATNQRLKNHAHYIIYMFSYCGILAEIKNWQQEELAWRFKWVGGKNTD